MRTDICKKIQNGIFYLDCGMGTSLQMSGYDISDGTEILSIVHPEAIKRHHIECYKAGSDLIYTNTFGLNSIKYSQEQLEKMIDSSLLAANYARDSLTENDRELYIGLDIGPTGKMLSPLGDLSFEDAVSAFADVIRCADPLMYDVIIVETMTDCLETKAAVIAAKENSDKPIFVTNVYDKHGRTLTGSNCASMVAMLEGLGVSALGLNCSLAPNEMIDVVKELASFSSLPLIVKPNAGLPDICNGKYTYNITPDDFADSMADIVKSGAHIIGGCCGTNPQFIKSLVSKTQNIPVLPINDKQKTVVSSYTHAVCLNEKTIPIGERINPTGKSKLRNALINSDFSYITSEAIGQAEHGAKILDVNVGSAEIDEVAVMQKAVKSIQEVCDLPIQIDSNNQTAIEMAMREYRGKPLVNSVTGKKESMSAVFPIVKKYGGVVVGLTIDENGIPETADERIKIALKIITTAAEYGINKKDIIIDPLSMALSATPDAAVVALECIKRLNMIGVCTILGISNISFGLPNRDYLNGAFLSAAMCAGLSAAIINPYSDNVMNAFRGMNVIFNKDTNCEEYISSALSLSKEPKNEIEATKCDTISGAIINGMSDKAKKLTEKALSVKNPIDIINADIVPALDVVGKDFAEKKIFLPQLLMAANAAGSAFGIIKSAIPKSAGKFTIVMATVKGDIHDIGKNIVITMLENYAYNVIDLGKDVEPSCVLDCAIKNDAKIIGLSALMTTTLKSMAETVSLLKEKYPCGKVVVGGAVLTQEYADSIGADYYAKDAMDTVRYAERLYNNEK